MKKIISIVLGVAALAACTKTSVSYEQPGEIALAPVTRANMTKAAITGEVFPTSNDMGVYAYYNTAANAGTAKAKFLDGSALYLNDVHFINKNDSNWGGETSYYWPKTGSLVFAAYSPKAAGLAYDATGNSFSKTDYVQETDLSKTVDLLWSPMTATSYDKATAAVPMTFYHAMSWITIKVKAANEDSQNKFRVKSILLNKIIDKGSFVTSVDSDGKNIITWTPSIEGADKKTLSVFNKARSEDSHVVATTTAVDLENAVRGTVVIPQSLGEEATLTIVFSQENPAGGFTADQTLTFKLKDCKIGTTAIDSWVNGKHYIYTLSFNIKGEGTEDNEILIAPSLKDWKDVTVDNINAK